jgi:hypothetical protein
MNESQQETKICIILLHAINNVGMPQYLSLIITNGNIKFKKDVQGDSKRLCASLRTRTFLMMNLLAVVRENWLNEGSGQGQIVTRLFSV